MLLLAVFVSAWAVYGAARQIRQDGRSGYRSWRQRMRDRASEIRSNRKAPRLQRYAVLGTDKTVTTARVVGRGARKLHRSAAAGARWGMAEGAERARERDELRAVQRDIDAEADRARRVGESEPSEVYHELHRRFYDTEARIRSHREARGSRQHRGDAGPGPRMVDGELRFGADPEDPNGVAECLRCVGGAVLADGEICPDCQRRQRVRNQWHDRDNRSAGEWFAERRKAQRAQRRSVKQAAAAGDEAAWQVAVDAEAQTKRGDWGVQPPPGRHDSIYDEVVDERGFDPARDADLAEIRQLLDRTDGWGAPAPEPAAVEVTDPVGIPAQREDPASVPLPSGVAPDISLPSEHRNAPMQTAGASNGRRATNPLGGKIMTAAVNGEAVNIAAARDALDQLKQLGEQAGEAVETLSASLSGARIDSETLSEVSEIAEAAEGIVASAEKAREGLDSRHALMEEAVNETGDVADLEFYRSG